jgi:hypothetical protein
MMPYGSFSLQLIALTAGVALFIWALNSDDRGAILGRFFGFIVMLLAFLAVVCSMYSSIKFWMQPASVYEVVQVQNPTQDSATPATPSTHKEKSTDKKK